ncbi:polyphosphate--glucose phosphotransferase [Rhodococcus maanshanensis]|uniref:Polyphosphate glucokinase n=1 Tax=Rhodococcus maanshanensis TaxID=183556 RepID=A0A1H7I565_9NOCA|nr:ROK family protein [Rhodococcus maanshanensis]SEK57568.1 polyphosphate glucokinase [Rhodococcus maanshanensis]
MSTRLGIDVGGTGIKAGLVDIEAGRLVGERITVPTPRPSTPAAVATAISDLAEHYRCDGPVGVALPAAVAGGLVQTAANIDRSWIGTDATDLFADALGGRDVAVTNDADAAGTAEYRFGAARGTAGVVIALTFGTGIGSAILHDGVLLPNTEFGHLVVDGVTAEHRASASAKSARAMSFEGWAREVSRVLTAIEDLLSPRLFVVGGEISQHGSRWIPLLTNRIAVAAAELGNAAGVIGAALAIEHHRGEGPLDPRAVYLRRGSATDRVAR